MMSPGRVTRAIGRRTRRLADIHLAGRLQGIRECRDRHRRQRAFLIGNGPSVRESDLERLSGELTFCFNRFHLAYPGFAFRPSYTVVADDQMMEQFGSEIAAQSHGRIVLASAYPPTHISSDFLWVCLHERQPFRFSEAAQRYVVPGGSVAVVTLQIAYFMGIREIYLYGVDHYFNSRPIPGQQELVTGEGNHFIPNYRDGKPWFRPNTDQIDEALRVCRDVYASQGGSIFNATRGGRLEGIDRIDFDSVASGAEKPAPGSASAAPPHGRNSAPGPKPVGRAAE